MHVPLAPVFDFLRPSKVSANEPPRASILALIPCSISDHPDMLTAARRPPGYNLRYVIGGSGFNPALRLKRQRLKQLPVASVQLRRHPSSQNGSTWPKALLLLKAVDNRQSALVLNQVFLQGSLSWL